MPPTTTTSLEVKHTYIHTCRLMYVCLYLYMQTHMHSLMHVCLSVWIDRLISTNIHDFNISRISIILEMWNFSHFGNMEITENMQIMYVCRQSISVSISLYPAIYPSIHWSIYHIPGNTEVLEIQRSYIFVGRHICMYVMYACIHVCMFYANMHVHVHLLLSS